jgi:thioredoxin-like negative regulator of GroEL
MKRILKAAVFVLSATAFSALPFLGGCSQNTQSADAAPTISQAPDQAPQSAPPKPAPAQKPRTATPHGSPQKVKSQKINWQSNWDAAFRQAKAQQKPVMVDFYATWCGPCHFLADSVYTAPVVIEASRNFVSVKVDVDQHADLAQKYQVSSMPTIAFFDAQGNEITRESGVPGDAQVAAEWLVGVMSDARTKSAGTPA